MTKQNPIKSSILSLTFCVLSLCFLSACTTTYNKLGYQALMDQAKQKGFARIQVDLKVKVPLEDMGKLPPAVKSELAKQEKALLAELGNTISAYGRWSNGIGQIGVYATAEGIKRIANSDYVRYFCPTVTDKLRATTPDASGLLMQDIEAEITQKGHADVEAILNLENFDYTIEHNGSTKFVESSALDKEVAEKLPTFLGSLPTRNITRIKVAKSKATNAPSAMQILRIDREGLFALKEHPGIRTMRLVKTPPVKPVRLDADVLEAAKRDGFADVIISLRQPFGYSPQSGRIPAKAWKAQKMTLYNTFKDVFSVFEKKEIKALSPFAGLLGAHAHLSLAALQALYQKPDARIQRIALNKPMTKPLLDQSTASVNMPQAWDKGYTAAGQIIVMMDMAFKKDHPFLQQPNGQPKIVFESCFGTNGSFSGPNAGRYESLCPQQNEEGDSPIGLEGSASNSLCDGDPALANLCFHGTGMASVAAGKRNWWSDAKQQNLTGMAPDANIAAISVMSKKTSSSGDRLWGYRSDVLAATALVASYAQSIGDSLTLNMSIGDRVGEETIAAPCPGEDELFDSYVAMLVSNNVPVIASTGNEARRGTMYWPACAPNVIKVAAVDRVGTPTDTNNASKDELWFFSNVVNPNLLPPDAPLFLAPCCAVVAIHNAPYSTQAQGTSVSAPHVSGLYAAIKAAVPGITVAQATEWIMANATKNIDTGLGYSLPSIFVPQQ